MVFLISTTCKNADSKKKIAVPAISAPTANKNYELIGDGDSTLVFLHGWNINRSYWDSQIDYFSTSYRTLAVDLIHEQHVKDTLRNWTIDEFARDITAVIEKEKLDNLILIGHTMSGEICLSINQRIPEKVLGIIGIDNFKEVGFDLSQYDRREIDGFVDGIRDNYQEEIRRMVEGLFPKQKRNEEAFRRVLKDFQAQDSVIATTIFRNMYEVWDNTKHILPKLDDPLYLVLCDFSPFNEQDFQKYIPNGFEIITIHNSGHYPMIEQPKELNKAIQSFLDRIRLKRK